jgi:hypothetical protein
MGFRRRARVPRLDFTQPVGRIPRVFSIPRGPSGPCANLVHGCRRPGCRVGAQHERGNASACPSCAALPTGADYELSGPSAVGVGSAGANAR